MLRCNNVIALRTSVGNAMAMRPVLAPSCTRTFKSRSSATSLCLSVARPARVISRPGPWRPLGDVKAYSTDHNETPEAGATKPKGTKWQPKHRLRLPEYRLPEENDEYLFALAMDNEKMIAATSKRKGPSNKAVQQELNWLQDPKDLADRVQRALDTRFEVMAVALVRAAQRQDMECAVAWNHLLEHCMKKNSARSAFRFYNDMKKRGRKPTSRTYTIMIDGLSKSKSTPGLDPVETALNIYRSISAANSEVELSIIHSNAMLTVCARHACLDTLWLVASELPEDGPGSPNATTYSIILNTVHNAAVVDVEKISPDDIDSILARKARGVAEGRRVWADVVYRWKRGSLELDNLLLRSMSQVLLDGPGDYEIYEVFRMLNQTTGLPILAKEPRKISYNTKSAQDLQDNDGPADRELEDVPFVDEGERLYRPPQPETDTLEEGEGEEAEAEEENLDDVFKAVVPDDASSGVAGPARVPLTNRELFTIVDACSSMTQGVGLAKEYWKFMTRDSLEFMVEPDERSFTEYLRVLQASRASRAAVQLMRDEVLPSGRMWPQTFLHAFKTCRRDINNINVLKHANELLELMDTSTPLPNIKSLDTYLSLISALLQKPQLLVSLNGIAEDSNRSASLEALGRELQVKLQIVAIDNLRPHAVKLEEALERGERNMPRTPYYLENPRHWIVPGAAAVKTLERLRYMMDFVLDPQQRKYLPKPVRKEYNELAWRLRKYSDKKLQQKLKGTLVNPTPEQRLKVDQSRGQADEADGTDGAEGAKTAEGAEQRAPGYRVPFL